MDLRHTLSSSSDALSANRSQPIAGLATAREPTLAAPGRRVQTGMVTRVTISTRYRAILAATGLLFGAVGLSLRAQEPASANAAQIPAAKTDTAPPQAASE